MRRSRRTRAYACGTTRPTVRNSRASAPPSRSCTARPPSRCTWRSPRATTRPSTPFIAPRPRRATRTTALPVSGPSTTPATTPRTCSIPTATTSSSSTTTAARHRDESDRTRPVARHRVVAGGAVAVRDRSWCQAPGRGRRSRGGTGPVLVPGTGSWPEEPWRYGTGPGARHRVVAGGTVALRDRSRCHATGRGRRAALAAPSELLAELLEAREVVAADEHVDVRKRRLHAADERLVGRVLLQRVEPDDAVRKAAKAGHLARQQLGISDLEAVRADDDDGAAGEPGLAVVVEEALERVADPRAALPVGDRFGRAPHRLVRVGARERSRHVRQAGAEAERLPAAVGPERGMGEEHERARVVGHRARDVEQEQEAALPAEPRPPAALDRLAARAEGPAQGAPHVGRAAARGAVTARASRRHGER